MAEKLQNEVKTGYPVEPEASEVAVAPSEASSAQYTGLQLIKAAQGINRDVMAAVLSPAKLYTAEQAETIVKNFLKKEVVTDGRRKLDNAK